MLIIGLTGGIGSGKSTVARYFERLGAPVIDADVVARDVVSPGSDALHDVVERFGDGVLHPDGTLDRGRLRTLVFDDPERRTVLERILHPRIYAEMKRRIAALSAPYCIAVIPLLLETGRRDFVDRVLVIDVPEELQRARAQARDRTDAATVTAIMQAQVDRASRRRAADDLISNDGDLAALERQAATLHHRYLTLAATKK